MPSCHVEGVPIVRIYSFRPESDEKGTGTSRPGDDVPDSVSVRNDRCESAQMDSRTAQRRRGQNVVVNGGVGWILVQSRQGNGSLLSQILEGEQVTIESFTWEKTFK
jgi:hypothetical protein